MSQDETTGRPSRARRKAATKSIDYGKEQQFSDDDVFEDGSEEKPTPRAPRRSTGTRRPRKSVDPDAPGGGAMDGGGAPGGTGSDSYRPARQYYCEKGYDPLLPPLRDRFTFEPEIEEDGSPKIDLIVGRRPIEDKAPEKDSDDEQEDEMGEDESNLSSDGGGDDDSDDDDSGGGKKRKKSKRNNKKKGKKGKKPAKNTGAATKAGPSKRIDYEYLVKYKGKSYLHLQWKTASDLESMNKSAKTLYRRFIKKLAAGMDDDLEDPEVDPSFIQPSKIVDEEEQEVMHELSDKELVEWEKERERELAEEEEEEEEEEEKANAAFNEGVVDVEEKKDGKEGEGDGDKEGAKDEDEEIGEPGTLTIDQIRKLVNKDGPYYPVIEGSNNPYRDGYITEPPKKARASYLFFQGVYRAIYQKKHAGSSVGEIMTILGDTWRAIGEEGQAPFIQLAQEEVAQFEREKVLLEKAQKAGEVWQPLRRCEMVLNRLCEDGYSSIFREPVDVTDFPDYEEFVEHPMDLGTVREKLGNRKYQAPENFARDMRKIWNNCKVYNQHGSAIWHVADYMSKQFERLYHAWVLEFRTRYLRWVDPRARPWEHSCRACDGKCGTPDDKMVLCDHCDANYGMACLRPPLTTVPDVWHCQDCTPKLGGEKGSRMLSAVSEYAARKRAELGDTPKKKVNKKMFLVKWAGLGYEHCSWETAEDINDDALIAEFRRLNNMTPDEPDLLEGDVKKVLAATTSHITQENAGGNWNIPDLRSQLYSQTRAAQFSKFGSEIPKQLALECGAKTKATTLASSRTEESSQRTGEVQLVEEVVECVSNLVDKVCRFEKRQTLKLSGSLPPLLTGEYDAVVPITSKGLMMNVGEIHGSVAFLGYRQFPDGSKGPSEIHKLIRSVGDKIIAVDGTSTVNKSFKQVIMLLRESGKNKYAYMRFLENKVQGLNGELTSMGTSGLFTVEELYKKFRTDRRRLLAKRRQQLDDDEEALLQQEDEESDESVAPQSGSDSDSEDSDASGSDVFEPDSEDEELVIKQQVREQIASQVQSSTSPDVPKSDVSAKQEPTEEKGEEKKESMNGDAVPPETASNGEGKPLSAKDSKASSERTITCKQETTRSLAYRLLDIDVGYSSDEGGDEDCAYFVDGVDSTFTTKREVDGERNVPDEDVADTKEKDSSAEELTLPVKRNEFSALGERSKLSAAIALTNDEADPDDFDNYPLPSTKELEAKKKAEAEAKRNSERLAKEKEASEGLEGEADATKLSKTKVEQVDTKTNDVVRVWAKAEDVSATLQIPLDQINQILSGEYSEDLGDEVGGYRWRFAAHDAVVTTAAGTGKGDKKSKDAFLEFRDKLYDHEHPHPYKNNNKLRDYQIDGVNWLASCWYKRHSCILADEMGLGKTVQIVSYIEHIYRVEKIQRPFLVVVPLSTVEHWRREFEGWTDMRCCVYHDRQRVWRDVMREYEWYYIDRPHTAEYLKFDVLVTTYDTLIGDFDVIGQIPWRVAVVDEAHRLRNVKGKLLECMKEISARGTLEYGYQSRVLMTGTPLQNNTQELWTLLNFIEPFKFPSLDDFEANFGDMTNRTQVEALQKKISPFMLRRVKEDVAKDIPAKEETLIDVELTSIQKQYYRAIFEHNHSFLSMGSSRQTAPKLMNIQMELRKCCNHPFLLDGVETRELENHHKDLYESGAFDGKSPEDIQEILNVHGYIQTSGKMVLLDKLLPKLRKEGHKVLIFSQMVKMLDLLSEYMDLRGFNHETLTGRVRGNERQKAIDRFNTEEDSFAFLLSTRAGGVGINLTAADICIIFDSDWNPQNDVQAQARCHRIGQTKDVRIYRLITSRSFEQEMFDRASRKLGLEQAVLGTFGQDDDDGKPTAKEMEQLLKQGAYALVEDDDEMGNEFCADDIESILEKRTRTRVVEGVKTATWLNKSGLNVTKSKFSGDSKSAGIDVDDPLFWQKVMPDFVTPTIMMNKLDEISQAVEDGPPKGPGRGRKKGFGKKAAEGVGDEVKGDKANDEENPEEEGAAVDAPTEEDKEEEKAAEESMSPGPKKKKKELLTRANQKKVNKFIGDLTSMMDDIFEQDEDDSLPQSEKAVCQKLLLTVSVKAKIFTEEHRNVAKVLLKRLEGDRRRRCRTGGDEPARFASMNAADEPGRDIVPEELMIRSTKKKRKKRRKKGEDDEEGEDGDDDEPLRKKRKKSKPVVGEDGYLHHSDSEEDWSDVGESIYETSRNARISQKEARRRRAWASDKDAAAAAGRAWPSFPRNMVSKVLGTLLDEMIKYDQSKGGVFSVPVPPDDFPEYYEMVKKPMDYGTMKTKLANGEYRSAQAMQKDFILVMANCVKFNASDSDIVKEARQQALMRPTLLKNAATEHNLFIAEDGTVLETFDEEEEKKRKAEEKAQEKEAKAAAKQAEKEAKAAAKKAEAAAKKAEREAKAAEKKGKKKSKTKKAKDDVRFVRCGECEGCQRDDCGECAACQDKPKFGGNNALKQGCIQRKCEDPQEQTVSSKKKKKGGKKGKKKADVASESDESDAENVASDDEAEKPASSGAKKPRIRISLGGKGKGKAKATPASKKKRKREEEGEDESDADEDEDGAAPASAPRKKGGKKKRKIEEIADDEEKPLSQLKKRGKKKQKKADEVAQEVAPEASNDDDDDEESNAEGEGESDPASAFLDVELLKSERELLDGTFDAAKENLTNRGPWGLPAAVEDKFAAIAKQALVKMNRHDSYQIFFEEVTEDEAPGYSDVVKQPMDFGKMRAKVEKGEYGEGSEAAAKLYEDFLLVFDNCAAYNEEGEEVMDEAARVLGLLPETFAAACVATTGKAKARKR